MKPMRRLAPLVLLLLLAPACARSFPTPPPPPTLDGYPLARFDRVSDGVYRSSQPSERHLRELVGRYRIRTIIKLNAGAEPELPGVKVLRHPINPLSEPSPRQLQGILDDIDRDRAQGPVLIHCTYGEDRTGLVVALYKMRHGTPVDAAYADMMRRGFHPYDGLFRAWVRAAGWGRPSGGAGIDGIAVGVGAGASAASR